MPVLSAAQASAGALLRSVAPLTTMNDPVMETPGATPTDPVCRVLVGPLKLTAVAACAAYPMHRDQIDEPPTGALGGPTVRFVGAAAPVEEDDEEEDLNPPGAEEP